MNKEKPQIKEEQDNIMAKPEKGKQTNNDQQTTCTLIVRLTYLISLSMTGNPEMLGISCQLLLVIIFLAV